MGKNKISRKNKIHGHSSSSALSSDSGPGVLTGGAKEPQSILSLMTSPFMNILHYINTHVMFLNNSKFFAGVVMILLNVGSKFITIQFSKSTEEYLKFSLSKQLLVFSMSWMGTRDIYTALGLTAIFTILSDHLFNEESHLCVVPHQYRVLHKAMDLNNDNEVSESELASAVAILEKAKKEKEMKEKKEQFLKFDYQANKDSM